MNIWALRSHNKNCAKEGADFTKERGTNQSKNDVNAGAGVAIIDDEKELVRLYEMVFPRRGFTVCFVAHDGFDGVRKFAECKPRPTIVLMDYRLPTMNGIDAAKQILQIEPRTRIIFISADASAENEAKAAGAYTFLKKPTSINEIIKAINKTC
jgi:two-component system chemotaxis response regulator CheY